MEEVNSKLWIHWMEKPSRVNLSIIHNIASSEKLLHIMIITPVKDRTAYGRRRGFLHCICYLKTVKNVFLLKLTWITVWKTENHSDELINCTVNPGDMKRLALNKYIQHYHHHINTCFYSSIPGLLLTEWHQSNSLLLSYET